MYLGRIIGNVVASAKYETFEGFKLLLVQPLDRHQRPKGAPVVATDRIGVGPGELVFLEKSKEAILGLDNPLVPSDASIVAKVDGMHFLTDED